MTIRAFPAQDVSSFSWDCPETAISWSSCTTWIPSPTDGHLHHHQFGSSHVCFNVADLEGIYTDLSGKGIRFVTEPKYRTTPDGARVGISYALDPEGNYLEFIERIEPSS